MYECFACLPVSVFIPSAFLLPSGARRGHHIPWELELQMVVICHVEGEPFLQYLKYIFY